jgi:hypothetical protein
MVKPSHITKNLKGMSISLCPIYCSSSHILLWIYFSKFGFFFQIDPQIYFIEQLHPFRLNSKEIESNLLTKNKIERSGTRLEKAPQMDDDFKVHKKKFLIWLANQISTLNIQWLAN